MPLMNHAQIARVLDELSQRLVGDWLLVGGALVSVWLDATRTTEDVDIIPIRGDPNRRLDLIDATFALGMPVEAVNSAADYFVFKIADWERHIVLMRETSSARIFRPTTTLFVLLKIGRLSEKDLLDCRAVIAAHREELDVPRVLAGLAQLKSTTDQEVLARREELAGLLTPRGGGAG